MLLIALSIILTMQLFSQSDTGSYYFIELQDGAMLTGKIISNDNNGFLFWDYTLGDISLKQNEVKKLKKVDTLYCTVSLKDGKETEGMVLSLDKQQIKVASENYGIIILERTNIDKIKLFEKNNLSRGKYFFDNPHATRYFFGPSAIPLKKGEGYFQNAYVLLNGAQYGLSNSLSVGGGLVIPIGFFLTPKISTKIADNWYLGGGILFATTFQVNSDIGIGIGYGVITYGNKENNITLGVGYGAVKRNLGVTTYDSVNNIYYYTSSVKWANTEWPVFKMSAMWRVAKKCAIISENWMLSERKTKEDYNGILLEEYYRYTAAISLGVRLMGEKNSFDIGVISIPEFYSDIAAIPYIDYVFKF